RWHERGWRLKGVFDQLDHAYFPTKGWRWEGSYVHTQANARVAGAPDGSSQRLDMQGQWAYSIGDHGFNLAGRLAMSRGASPDVPRFSLGGFQQLSGYGPNQVS